MTRIPTAPGGWWHDYVCPTHGTELVGPDGDGHRCSRGCLVVGPRADGAHRVLEHQACARELRRTAHRAAATGAVEDRRTAVAMLEEYAKVYAGAVGPGWNEDAEPWMLRGRLFAQALTEAQWAVQVADAAIVLGPGALAPSVEEMFEDLLATIEQSYAVLVEERQDERNNYTAWLGAAGALVARALGAPDDIHAQWRHRVLRHVELAVGDDGWEWEGSTYYHLFVLRAYLLALRDADPADLPGTAVEKIAAMIRVLAEVAAPDGRIPALHDGPYDRVPAHREVLEIATLARGLVTPVGLDTVERFARDRVGDADDGLEASLTDWFAGGPVQVRAPSRDSVLFEQVGYAVLRDADDTFQVVVDAGPHGGSHGHHDKLAAYLYGAAPWQPAPGVPPYASPLRHGHYARTVAHPTVRVAGADQDPVTGRVERWDPAAGCVVVSAEPYPGVRMRRTLQLGTDCVADVTVVETDSPRDLALALRPAVELAVRTRGGGAETIWTAPDGATLHGFHASTTSAAPAALVVGPGRGPSDDPAATRDVADWTVAAAEHAVLASLYHHGSRPPQAVDIEIAPDGGATFRPTGPDGAAHTIEVAP
ncbi:heparinase II/III domain-containing protein [Isoptericola jiangsuensis]|uniref:heparinase II/III domain-containing protein n=1 Tax=Isoptericola jiangsuensis TaxID=548579 RepID=UPI003AB06A05